MRDGMQDIVRRQASGVSDSARSGVLENAKAPVSFRANGTGAVCVRERDFRRVKLWNLGSLGFKALSDGDDGVDRVADE